MLVRKMRTYVEILLITAVAIGASGCSTSATEIQAPGAISSATDTRNDGTTDEETPEAEGRPQKEDGWTLFNCEGVIIAIPDEYIDRLIIRDERIEREDATVLLSVYERKSVEEYEKDGGERYKKGFMFSISRCTPALYELYRDPWIGGMELFAKDNDYYYGFVSGHDPWAGVYRQNDEMTGMDWYNEFTELLDIGPTIVDEIMARNNNLASWSDSDIIK